MTCAVCGRILTDGTTRCASCGARAATAEPRESFTYTADPAGAPRELKPDGPFEWYLRSFSKYAEFGGRATRSEYWYFFLMNIAVSAVLAVGGFFVRLPWAYLIYAVAALIPGFAVMVRRLHDTGRSGWWWLISFLPLIGQIVLLVFLAQDTEPSSNSYGPNPKNQWT